MKENSPKVERFIIDGARGEYGLPELMAGIAKGKWVVLTCTFLGVAAAGAYLALVRPSYEATTRVLVDFQGREEAQPRIGDGIRDRQAKLANEIEILSSASLRKKVALALIRKGTLDEDRNENMPLLSGEVEELPSSAASVTRKVEQRLEKCVEFSPVRESDVIRIVVESTAPAEAALVANTYAEIYVQSNLAISRARSTSVKAFLTQQVENSRKSLSEAEEKLRDYMSAAGVVNLDEEISRTVEQLAGLEAARDAIAIEAIQQEREIARYRETLEDLEPKSARAIKYADDSYIKALQEQLARLEVQRDVIAAENPQYVGESIYSDKLAEINRQITALRGRLDERTKLYLESLMPAGTTTTGLQGTTGIIGDLKQKLIQMTINYDGLKAKGEALGRVVREYESRFARIPHRKADLAILQRDRLSKEKLFLLLQEKLNEVSIRELSEPGYVTIVDRALIPDKPVSPKPWIVLIQGLLGGLLLGIASVVFRSVVVRKIADPDDLRRHSDVGFAVIGHMRIPANARASTNGRTNGAVDRLLVTLNQPFSPEAESYRHLSKFVEYSRPDQSPRQILVTSADEGEGKTTTAANLAIALAEGEKRVLLVDADLRRPMIHRMFGVPKAPGLTDVLVNGVSLAEAATPASIRNLRVLGCGSVQVHPSEILGSKRMQAFLEAARSEYDIVVLDSPPLLAVADVAIVAPRVDGVLIVARAGKTKVAFLDRAVEALNQVRADLIGIVLNDFKLGLSRASYYGGYGYYGGHSSYYTEADRKPGSTPSTSPHASGKPDRPRAGRSRLRLAHRFMLWRARFVWWMFQLILGRRARARKGASEGLGQA